jgi:hypothetical protein
MAGEDKGIVKPEDLENEPQVDQVEDQVETKVETKEPSDIEKRAIDMGWRPKEEFEGEEDDFIDAKEFVRRKPLFDKIETTGKELKQVRKALEQFKHHYDKVRENEYNRAMRALKAARKEALENGEGERFEAIDTQIKEVETQVQELQKSQQSPVVQDEATVPYEFQVWSDRNRWYGTKTYMKVWADEFGQNLLNQGLTPQAVLTRVESEVRNQFPKEFNNPRKSQAPSVESSRNTGTSKKSTDNYPLTEDQRKAMNNFVRLKLMSKEEYIQSLQALDE